MWARFVPILVLFAAASVAFFLMHARGVAASAFFEHALQSESVAVGAMSDKKLAVTYARLLAERSPIMALPGEDIEALRSSVDALEKTALMLAALQNSEDSALVSSALYPFGFLRALADAESARQAFIASGERDDMDAYHTLLLRALKEYMRALKSFRSAIGQTLPEQGVRYAMADSVVNKSDIVSYLNSLEKVARERTRDLVQRSYCLRGYTSLCPSIRLQALPSVERVTIEPHERRLADDTMSILADALGPAYEPSGEVVATPQSACADTMPGAPLFIAHTDAFGSERYSSVIPVGNIRLIPTDPADTSFLEHFAALGAEHVWHSPVAYYKCFRAHSDAAHVTTTLEVASLAAETPLSTYASPDAKAEMAELEYALREGIVQQSDAVRYIELSRTQPLSEQEARRVATLALKFAAHAADLSETVRRIALNERVHMLFTADGVGMDLVPPRLFLSESAFVALFLGDNLSFTHDDARLPPNNLESDIQPFVYYSELGQTASSNDDIIRDIRIFFDTHRSARI